MCSVSMVGDHYRELWPNKYPLQPWTQPPVPQVVPGDGGLAGLLKQQVTRAEFDALRADVLEMKSLLKRTKDYDERNNEPHCEIEEKMEFLRQVAKFVGVNLDDVIGPNKQAPKRAKSPKRKPATV